MPLLLSRNQTSEFLRVDGLQKLTGVPASDWDLYILKELVDNALDADESVGAMNPTVTAQLSYDGVGFSATVRNRADFPIEYVEDIFHLGKRASEKDLYRLPTRGALGNALKTILAIPYALQYWYFANYVPSSTPLSIQSRDYIVDLRLDVDQISQTVVVEPTKRRLPTCPEGTEVSAHIFRFDQRQARNIKTLMQFAQSFALWNPNATLDFEFVVNGEVDTIHLDADTKWAGKFDFTRPAPIRWYSYREFREILYAVASHWHTHGGSEPTLGDALNSFGASLPTPFEGYPASVKLVRFLAIEDGRPGAIRRLYQHLRKLSSDQDAPNLAPVGEHAIRTRWPSSDSKRSSIYYRHISSDPSDDSPYVVEVALGANANGQHVLLTGINHTPTYRDPFLGKTLVSQADGEGYRGLEGLLAWNGLPPDSPITLAIHLISPTVVYENYGKSAIDEEPFREAIASLVRDIVKHFIDAGEYLDPLDYAVSEYLPQVEASLAGHGFSLSQLIYALKRQLGGLPDAVVARELAKPDIDARLVEKVLARHREVPIGGLLMHETGALSLPTHPNGAATVVIAEHPLLDLLQSFEARAIVVTNRPELEELLLALQFPTRYDVAILRSDGDLESAMSALVRSLAASISDSAIAEKRSPVSIWVVRDATIDGALVPGKMRRLLQDYHILQGCLNDLGLRAEEHTIPWEPAEQVTALSDMDVDTLRQFGVSQQEMDALLGGCAVMKLDGLPSSALIEWFESRLANNAISKKAIPDTLSLGSLLVEQLKELLRTAVERLAFESYELDSVVSNVVEEWQREAPDWIHRVHTEVDAGLEDRPMHTWRSVLQDVLNAWMLDFLTSDRVDQIRSAMRSRR